MTSVRDDGHDEEECSCVFLALLRGVLDYSLRLLCAYAAVYFY